MARVAIVTGGTRGIGRAICEKLQDAGFTVIANYAGNDAAAEQLKAVLERSAEFFFVFRMIGHFWNLNCFLCIF